MKTKLNISEIQLAIRLLESFNTYYKENEKNHIVLIPQDNKNLTYWIDHSESASVAYYLNRKTGHFYTHPWIIIDYFIHHLKKSIGQIPNSLYGLDKNDVLFLCNFLMPPDKKSPNRTFQFMRCDDLEKLIEYLSIRQEGPVCLYNRNTNECTTFEFDVSLYIKHKLLGDISEEKIENTK